MSGTHKASPCVIVELLLLHLPASPRGEKEKKKLCQQETELTVKMHTSLKPSLVQQTVT